MNIWFECKIGYEKTGADGLTKKVSENYLVDAFTFTDAEERITKEMQPYVSGSCDVQQVRKSRISELVPSQSGGKWYRCKMSLISVDEESGTEKRKTEVIMVQAKNVAEAVVNFHEAIKGNLCDIELTSVSETNILDVFVYAVN